MQPVTRRAAAGYSGAGPSRLLVSFAGCYSVVQSLFRDAQSDQAGISSQISRYAVAAPMRGPSGAPPRLLVGINRLLRGSAPAWLARFSSGAGCGSCLDCGISIAGHSQIGALGRRRKSS